MNHPRATNPTLGDDEPFIYKKGPAFGMPGVLVDGMDVLKVRQVAEEAIARARRGDGPTLIEAETYRYRGHSLADPDELRSKEEKAKYAVRGAELLLGLEGWEGGGGGGWEVAERGSSSSPSAADLRLPARRVGASHVAALEHTRRIPPTSATAPNPNPTPLQARDPIPQLKEYMLKNGLATEAEIKELHDKVRMRRSRLRVYI